MTVFPKITSKGGGLDFGKKKKGRIRLALKEKSGASPPSRGGEQPRRGAAKDTKKGEPRISEEPACA